MMMGFSFCPFPTQIKALLVRRNTYLTILNTTHYEQNLRKIYGPLVVLVYVVLLIDIVSDLIQKRKARKAEKNNTEVIDEEETAEPEPVME